MERLIFEFYAAVLSAIVTVTAMTILKRIHAQHDKEKEFSKKLFEKKLELYSNLINRIFEIDVDCRIDRYKISDIENSMAEATFSSKRNFSWPIAQWEIQRSD